MGRLGYRARVCVDVRNRYMAYFVLLLPFFQCLLIWYGGVGYGIWTEIVPLALSTYVFMGQGLVLLLPSLIGIIICQNGPFTTAFWSSQRKAVSIPQQGQRAASPARP